MGQGEGMSETERQTTGIALAHGPEVTTGQVEGVRVGVTEPLPPAYNKHRSSRGCVGGGDWTPLSSVQQTQVK